MKENKIKITINKPIEEVFKFTTNPQNTHLWIPSVSEEISEDYPPKINTIYKNKGGDNNWNKYKVIDLQENKIFALSDLDDNYFVKYHYNKIDDNKTEMEYFEYMTTGELKDPFTDAILENLKKVMEK